MECLEGITHIEWNDRTFCVANLKACLFELLKCIVGRLPKIFLTLWLRLEDVDGFECGSRCSRCVGRAENVGTAVVTEPVDRVAV